MDFLKVSIVIISASLLMYGLEGFTLKGLVPSLDNVITSTSRPFFIDLNFGSNSYNPGIGGFVFGGNNGETPENGFDNGDLEEPSGVIEEPSGVAEEPSGVVEEPSGVSEEPSRVGEEPSGVGEEPSGVVEEPSAIEEATSTVSSIVESSDQPSDSTTVSSDLDIAATRSLIRAPKRANSCPQGQRYHNGSCKTVYG